MTLPTVGFVRFVCKQQGMQMRLDKGIHSHSSATRYSVLEIRWLFLLAIETQSKVIWPTYLPPINIITYYRPRFALNNGV